MNDMILSLDNAWLCAAERDVEREEEERIAKLERSRLQGIKGKYELDTAAQLDKDLKHQQLELRKRAVKHQDRQDNLRLPQLREHGSAIREGAPLSPQEQQRSRSIKPLHKPNVYEAENQRLIAMRIQNNGNTTRLQKQRLQVKKKKNQPRIVEDMLSLERRYTRSARKIQQWWRSHLHTQFWKSYFRKVRAATQIQCLVRGFVCRAVVRTWHRNRTHRTTLIQAAVRGFLMRRVIAAWRQWEYVNVARIQSIVRGHYGRREATRRRQTIAALHIQSLWRGVQSRRRVNRLWLTVKAIDLQRLVRGLQARKRVHRRRLVFNQAATQIQRVFRGMQARTRVGEVLRDRETANRREWMGVLEAEEEWYRSKRDRLRARLDRFKLFEQVCDLEEKYFRAHERINDMEAIYLDMQTQRLRVSPRAIEHGWVEEMEQKMRAQRQLITSEKLAVVFDLGVKFKKKEEEYLELVQRIEALEEKRYRFAVARDEEFIEYWERECKFAHEQKERERRQRTAATKRRWRVQFYYINGKRDKNWRGTHWSKSVLDEGERRAIFSMSNTNLLAAIEAKWRKHLEGTSSVRKVVETSEEEAVRLQIRETEEQVALVMADAQAQQTLTIFDPVFRDIERRFHTVKHQQERNEVHIRAKTPVRLSPTVANLTDVANAKVIPQKVDTPEHQMKLRRALQASRIPWHMLDQLAADRRKLAEEKALFKAWRTVPATLLTTKTPL